MTTNYDAFIPILDISKRASSYFFSNYQSLSSKFISKKQTSSTFLVKKSNRKNLIMKNTFNCKEAALEIIKKELVQSKKNWKTSIRSLPLAYRRIVSILIFVSFVLSSWYLSPSKNRYISILASIVSGGLAFFLTNKINSKNITGVRYKILDAISSTEEIDFNKNIQDIKIEFGISSEDLKTETLNIYKKFLLFFLHNSQVKFEEIKELIKIKNFLKISSQEIGECHIDIARNLHKEYTVNLERKALDYSSDKLNKFVFLCDRIFSTDSMKGYQYELGRLRKIFLFSSEQIVNICSIVSFSSYSEIVGLLTENNFPYTENLDNIQKIFGINEEQKEKIHSDFIRNVIMKSISKEKKITDNDKNRIQTIKSVLKINDTRFQQILFDITEPEFYTELFDSINQCTDVLDDESLRKISEFILIKKSDLLIPSHEIHRLLSTALKNVSHDVINSILSDFRIQKSTFSLRKIEKLFFIKENSLNIIKNFGFLNQTEIDDIYNNGFFGLGKNFNSQEINQVFEYFVNNCFDNFSIKLENENKIHDLKKIFSISDNEYNTIYNNTIEPIFKQQILEKIEKRNFNKDGLSQLKQLRMSLKLKKKTAISIKIKIYQNYLQKFIELNNILSVENKLHLNAIKKFLLLKWSDVQPIYDDMNELFYKKAISEAMGASGFISIGYWDNLEKLRKKLQMTEKKARFVFYQVSKDKMRQLFDQAVIEHKRKLQIKEGKENKEDALTYINTGTALGIEAGNTSGSELSNLIDFYNRNKIFIERDLPLNVHLNKILKGLNGRVESKLCINIKTEYIYPVNLTGLFDKKIILEMYKQYLIECFSSKLQIEKRRLFNNLDKLGPILGIDHVEIKTIHTSVGSLVYKQFLGQALTKGFIDKSETAFLVSIQDTLSMDNSKCSELIKEAKKNRVAVFVENIFATPKINPDKVSEMRKMASQLGINLQKDLSISTDQCAKLFRTEIDSNIEKGLITSENQFLIEEIQSAFGLSKEIAKKVLLENVTSRCEGYLINSVASLRKNLTGESLKELQKMVKFGSFLPIKIQSTFASKTEKEQLLSLFRSIENQKDRLDLLKIMLNL